LQAAFDAVGHEWRSGFAPALPGAAPVSDSTRSMDCAERDAARSSRLSIASILASNAIPFTQGDVQ